MRASIRGLGMWLPSHIRRNDAWPDAFVEEGRRRGDRTLVDIPRGAGRAAEITARYLRAGADDPFMGAVERHVAAPDATAWASEVAAARSALDDAGIEAKDVDAVLSWSIVPDRAAHATAPKVAFELGADGAFALSADAGCASALVQLHLAAGLIEAGRARHVLLTQSHLITRAFPLEHPASPGIGDCATAVVVSASEDAGVIGVHSVTHGDSWDAVTWIRGRDEDTDTPWWVEGGPFFPGSRNAANAKALMRDTVQYGAQTVAEALDRFRVERDDICAFACVQPRGWTPAAVAEASGFDPGSAPDTYGHIAHVGGCGVIANLIAARDRGLLEHRRVVALYAQGAGFTRSAALLRWTNP